MADKKPAVNKEQIAPEETKPTELTTPEVKPEDVKPEETKPEVKKKYTIHKNVKYGDTIYKIGDKAELTDKQVKEFKAIGAIRVE